VFKTLPITAIFRYH